MKTQTIILTAAVLAALGSSRAFAQSETYSTVHRAIGIDNNDHGHIPSESLMDPDYAPIPQFNTAGGRVLDSVDVQFGIAPQIVYVAPAGLDLEYRAKLSGDASITATATGYLAGPGNWTMNGGATRTYTSSLSRFKGTGVLEFSASADHTRSTRDSDWANDFAPFSDFLSYAAFAGDLSLGSLYALSINYGVTVTYNYHVVSPSGPRH